MAKNVADCYKLFQSVAKCENLQIRRPDGLTPFSIVDEGELSTDGLEFAAAPQKSKIGSGPLALAAAYLTLHSHRAGHCGLGAKSRRGSREAGSSERFGRPKTGWPRDSVPTISRIRLAAAAASTPFIGAATTAGTDKRRPRPHQIRLSIHFAIGGSNGRKRSSRHSNTIRS